VGLTAGLLLFAGLYQFSSLKEACLSKCRQPLTFFMAHWDEGPWRNGLRLGAVCLGCCWALMALAFVGGVMNVAFMGLAALIMVLEKLPEIGRWVTRPLGVVLIAAAIWTGLSAV
jgi:predicted metal-binding membrane protein